jgi:hypothetical protein
VHVRPPRRWDELIGALRRRRFFGDPQLDGRLVVKSSSAALAATVLDTRVMGTVRMLMWNRLDELSYRSGAIAIQWGGVEADPAVLDDVLDVLGYLAVRGSEASAYR